MDGLPAQVTRYDGGRGAGGCTGTGGCGTGWMPASKSISLMSSMMTGSAWAPGRSPTTSRIGRPCWATRLSGTPGVVIDQPGAIARLALAVAARQGTPVAHVPGLVLRRAADVLLAMLRTGQPYQCARPAPCPARAA
jgi:hypothetical protein